MQILLLICFKTDTGTKPSPSVLDKITRDFGSLPRFKRLFESHADSVLGNGWCWLLHDSAFDRLVLVSTREARTPLIHGRGGVAGMAVRPVLGLDLWEGAYVVDYGVDRERYVRAWWEAVNWQRVSVLMG